MTFIESSERNKDKKFGAGYQERVSPSYSPKFELTYSVLGTVAFHARRHNTHSQTGKTAFLAIILACEETTLSTFAFNTIVNNLEYFVLFALEHSGHPSAASSASTFALVSFNLTGRLFPLLSKLPLCTDIPSGNFIQHP